MLEPGTRRGFITGALALITAPAIVKVASLMPVKASLQPWQQGVVAGLDMGAGDASEVHVLCGDNTYLTIDMITREATKLWENSNAFLAQIDEIALDDDKCRYAFRGVGKSDMVEDLMFYKGQQWERRGLVPDLLGKPVPAPLAAAAVVAAAAPVVERALASPVTRRFFSKA